jgi:hypothetical protein
VDGLVLATKRDWNGLSPAYQKRLKRNGITKRQYESGANLAKARGHAETPEHPEDVIRQPTKYQKYRGTLVRLQDEVILKKERLFGNRLRFNRERAEKYIRNGARDVPVPGIRDLRRALEMSDEDIEEAISQRESDDTMHFWWYH